MSEQTKQAVQVGALTAAVAPGIELAVQAPISGKLQTVQDENGNNTALALSNTAVQLNGQDVPGQALPLVVFGTLAGSGSPSNPSWGRVVRISTDGWNNFFDFGIDADGSFYINGPGSSPSAHVLAIAKGGIQPSTTAPKGANLESLFVDTNTGFLYHQ
ncbi:MAG TPA: hypothetical protein VE913_12655 [Longimicrobium sp.]|nr:hypothetical protein [Longimicrobium sp.]